jgi:hypothetical protein
LQRDFLDYRGDIRHLDWRCQTFTEKLGLILTIIIMGDWKRRAPGAAAVKSASAI